MRKAFFNSGSRSAGSIEPDTSMRKTRLARGRSTVASS
jgi:hypothetical protein